jgi:hypothetical protein
MKKNQATAVACYGEVAGHSVGCAFGLNLGTTPHGTEGVIDGDFMMPSAVGRRQGGMGLCFFRPRD